MKKLISDYMETINYLPRMEQIARLRCYVSTFLPEDQRYDLDGIIISLLL